MEQLWTRLESESGLQGLTSPVTLPRNSSSCSPIRTPKREETKVNLASCSRLDCHYFLSGMESISV